MTVSHLLWCPNATWDTKTYALFPARGPGRRFLLPKLNKHLFIIPGCLVLYNETNEKPPELLNNNYNMSK